MAFLISVTALSSPAGAGGASEAAEEAMAPCCCWLETAAIVGGGVGGGVGGVGGGQGSELSSQQPARGDLGQGLVLGRRRAEERLRTRTRHRICLSHSLSQSVVVATILFFSPDAFCDHSTQIKKPGNITQAAQVERKN